MNGIENTLTIVLLKQIISGKMRYTFKQFKAEYPDDAACLKAVLDNRYGDTCPRCGVVGMKWHPITGRQGFVCSECDRHVYPLADTIFRSTHVSLWDWFHAIYLFSVSKNGVSAKELSRITGFSYKTCWRMCKQIRLLMQQDGDLLSGTVEVDETYIGKKKGTRNWHNEKTAVYGVTERGGQAKAVVATGGVNATTAIPFLKSTVATGSKVMSDESHIYNRMKQDYIHEFVTHSKEEYVRGNVYTNTIEGLWGNWKKSMRGTYNRVSPKYLQSYLNEFIFRYNHRAIAVCPVLLERAGKRV
jgi:transposase